MAIATAAHGVTTDPTAARGVMIDPGGTTVLHARIAATAALAVAGT